jgi:hypothetical protein
MMARSSMAPSNRPDTEAQDQLLQIKHFRLATRGRSIQMGQTAVIAPYATVHQKLSLARRLPAAVSFRRETVYAGIPFKP